MPPGHGYVSTLRARVFRSCALMSQTGTQTMRPSALTNQRPGAEFLLSMVISCKLQCGPVERAANTHLFAIPQLSPYVRHHA